MLASSGRDRVFCWAPGVHRIEEPLRLHPGDTFVGLTDGGTGQRAIIDGSEPLEGWTEVSPSRWVADLPGLEPPPLNTPPGLRCIDGTDHCAYPDDVTWGDRRLTRVWSLADQGAGSYFVDYTADRIYVGVDPDEAPISRSVPLPVVSGRAQPLIWVQGGSVRNLVVRKVGVGLQGAAISGYAYVVKHVTVLLSHGRGIGADDLSVVASNRLYSNGQAGIGIGGHNPRLSGDPGVVARNRLEDNGWIRCLGICAGIKAYGVRDLTITRNRVSDTFGTGIWIDGGSINYRIAHNRVLDSTTAGIEMEISYDGVVRGNLVAGIGLDPMEDHISVGAIHILSSGRCTSACPRNAPGAIIVARNTLGTPERPNAFGFVLRQLARGGDRYGPHIVRGVKVLDNHVYLTQGWTGAVDPTGATAIYRRGNQFSGNTYDVDRDAELFRWRGPDGDANAWLTLSQWRGVGNDT
jgi:hypothetical protein